jgi:hypothetical protein
MGFEKKLVWFGSLTSRHIQAIGKYSCDVKSFRQTRRELLEILSKKRKNE